LRRKQSLVDEGDSVSMRKNIFPMIEKKDAKGIFLPGHQSLSMVVRHERPRPQRLRTVDGKIHDAAVLGSAKRIS
jgi:hypothetical protein